MNKKRLFTLVLTAFVLLTGCGRTAVDNADEKKSSSDTAVSDTSEAVNTTENTVITVPQIESIDPVTVSDAHKNAAKDYESIKVAGYKNFKINDFQIKIPDTPEVYELSLYYDGKMTGEELYEYFDETFEFFFPGRLTDEEKKHEIRISDTEHYTCDDSEVKYPYIFPALYDYMDKTTEYNLSESGNLVMLNTPEMYLCISHGALYTYNGGVYSKYLNAPFTAIPDLGNSNEILKFYTDTESEDKYKLLNGEMSIKDAVDFTEKYLDEIKLNGNGKNENFKPSVIGVKAVDIGNGNHGYSFTLGAEYKGVEFDYDDMWYDDIGTYDPIFSDQGESMQYTYMPGMAQMVEENKLDGIVIPPTTWIAKEERSSDKIVPITAAFKAASKTMTQAVSFEVNGAALVYREYELKSNGTREEKAEPFWKITMYNTGDNREYYFYMNALTGKESYAIRKAPIIDKNDLVE